MKIIFYKNLIFLLFIIFSSLASAACMKEGDVVNVSGELKKELFYGPPGWGEDPVNDEKLTYWILTLDKPFICITGANDEDGGWGDNTQLILSHKKYEQYRQLINNHVRIIGKIFLAQTGYHMTPVLLDDISEISSTN